jgi:hemoglobin
MNSSLFERLGSQEGIKLLAGTLVDNHLKNPIIGTRFAGKDVAKLKKGASTFFIAGTGGPNVYEGKDMLETHKGMNISTTEFMAFIDDAFDALQAHNVEQREQEEVMFIFLSLRKQVLLV